MSVRSKLTVASSPLSSMLKGMLGVELPEEQTEVTRKTAANNYVLKGRCVFNKQDTLDRSISPMLKGEDSFSYSPEPGQGGHKTPGKRYLPSVPNTEGQTLLSFMDEADEATAAQNRTKRYCKPVYEGGETGDCLVDEDETICCCICMEEVEKGVTKCIQCWQCNHYIHGSCLLRWFQSQNASSRSAIPSGGSCPNCRSDVNWEEAVLDMRDRVKPTKRASRSSPSMASRPLPPAVGSNSTRAQYAAPAGNDRFNPLTNRSSGGKGGAGAGGQGQQPSPQASPTTSRFSLSSPRLKKGLSALIPSLSPRLR